MLDPSGTGEHGFRLLEVAGNSDLHPRDHDAGGYMQPEVVSACPLLFLLAGLPAHAMSLEQPRAAVPHASGQTESTLDRVSGPVGACCDLLFLDEHNDTACREVSQADCPTNRWIEGASCEPDPFDPPCGTSACCTPQDTCENLTQIECESLFEPGMPIVWNRDEFCGDREDICPFYACVDAHGDCARPHVGAGCGDFACCEVVCDIDEWCCTVEWDLVCVREGQVQCDSASPSNELCFSPNPEEGALFVGANSMTLIGNRFASGSSDHAFCCHSDQPGDSAGYGSVWFKFIATHASARIHTCESVSPAEDSLIQVFRASDPERGICGDGSVCSVSKADCADGSGCLLNEQEICRDLEGIGCNDDVPGCGLGRNSDLCVADLIPGETYYVMLAAKSAEALGVYKLNIESPCDFDEGNIRNDYCRNASPIVEGVTPFYLTGSTFDCPGEDCVHMLRNDIWFDWTAPCVGTATVETCGGSDQATPNTTLVIYEGCDCELDAASRLACSFAPPSPCFLGSRTVFDVVKDRCYKIRLGGHLGAEPSGNLTITCDPSCPPGEVIWRDPPSGVVDARQTHPPDDPSAWQGFQMISLRVPDGADDSCFSLCETNQHSEMHPTYPHELEKNGIRRIISVDGFTYDVLLDRPITPGETTILRYTDDDGVVHSGSFTAHPANVDGNAVADPSDILALIDVLNDVREAPWGASSVDIDRDRELGPRDVLRLIDLLNAGWLHTTRPASNEDCP